MMHLLQKELCELRQLNQLLQEEISCRKLVELKLRSFEVQMRAVLGTINNLMLIVNISGDKVQNVEILPTKQSQMDCYSDNELISQTIGLFLSEQTSEVYLKKVCQVLETGMTCNFDYSLSCQRRPPENVRLYRATIYRVSDHSVLCITRDISECVPTEEGTSSEDKFQVLINSAPIGIFQTDIFGNCTFVNPRWLDIAGISSEEALGKGWIKALHPEDREQVVRKWYDTMPLEHEFAMECRFMTPEGKITWLKPNAVPIHDHSGNISGYLGTLTEINARKLVEKALEISEERSKQKVIQLEMILEQLREIANQDGLTQVANRYCFNNYLNEQWYNKNPIILILLDIDYFKNYNDTYGHPAGDACLVQVTNALRLAVKQENSLIARYGGEEFAVVLPNTSYTQAQEVAEVIRKYIQQLRIPHETSSVNVNVTVSMGIARALPSLNSVPQILIDKADEALYKAKKAGRDCYYTVFDAQF